jgi:hypothetical protein
MKFIRNASWTALTLGVLLVLGLVAGSIAAGPVLEAMHWMVGTKGLVLMGLAWVLFALTMFFPAWWAWWRARRAGLEDRWTFVVLVWGMAVGGVEACVAVLFVPAAVFTIFFVPQLQEMKVMSDDSRFLEWFVEYWWVAVPFLQGIAAVFATRFLARRWHAVRLAWNPAP